jgi:flagella basal body P-ring formation protein FlgA
VAPADAFAIATAGLPLQCSGGHAPWTGKQRFVVSFATPSDNSRYPIFAEVSASQTVVVATRNMERGEILTASAFESRQVDQAPAATARRMPVESVDSLVGLEAAKAIRAGDVIFNDDVRPRLLVRRGDEISVVASGGGIRVRTIAKAKQDGARGELISVEAPESKESYEAVVVGLREAAVFTGADSPAEAKFAEQMTRQSRQ